MKFSRHGVFRAEERSIYPEIQNKVLAGKIVYALSTRDDSAILITGKYDGKYWTIVMNIETGVVITARRAHAKEIKLYMETYEKKEK